MNKKLFLLYISSLWLAIRIVVFEKYRRVVLTVWWVTALLLGYLVNSLWCGSGFMVLAIAVTLYRQYAQFMEKFKPRLIRIGDRVEFAQEEEGGYIQKFGSARVLRRMRGEDVAISGFFSDELLPLYSHFFLVEMADQNTIIPYEWVLSIEVEELPSV